MPDTIVVLHTIEHVSLDLGPCVAQLVECIICFASQSAVLNRCHNVHKDIVLHNFRC